MWSFPLFPEQASSLARRIDYIYFALLAFALFFTTLICFLIVAFAVKYRRGSKADRSHAITHSNKLELSWVTIPSLISIGLFFWAATLFFRQFSPPPDAAEIYVVGKQ